MRARCFFSNFVDLCSDVAVSECWHSARGLRLFSPLSVSAIRAHLKWPLINQFATYLLLDHVMTVFIFSRKHMILRCLESAFFFYTLKLFSFSTRCAGCIVYMCGRVDTENCSSTNGCCTVDILSPAAAAFIPAALHYSHLIMRCPIHRHAIDITCLHSTSSAVTLSYIFLSRST